MVSIMQTVENNCEEEVDTEDINNGWKALEDKLLAFLTFMHEIMPSFRTELVKKIKQDKKTQSGVFLFDKNALTVLKHLDANPSSMSNYEMLRKSLQQQSVFTDMVMPSVYQIKKVRPILITFPY